MAPSIWSKLPKSAQVKLIAAGLALGGAAKAAGDEEVLEHHVEIEGQGNVRVQVWRAEDGQLQVQIGPNGFQLIPPGQPTSKPADVKAGLTLTQPKPGAPATFTFALPAGAGGVLAGEPQVSTYFGTVRVVPRSVTKTGCSFTWDVASARKQAPKLRGTEMRVTWQLARPAPKGQPQPAPTTHNTVAHVTIGQDGAVAVTDVNTSAVVIRMPHVCEMAPMPVYRYAFGTGDLKVSAIRFRNSKNTSITVRLTGGHQFTAQPDLKLTVGALGTRRKWNPKRTNSYESVNWTPPKQLPKKDTEGTMTWAWKSKAPVTGEEKEGTLTLKVKVSPAGDLTILKVESKAKVTKKGRVPQICEMAPMPALRGGANALPGPDDRELPLASRFQAVIRSHAVAPGQVHLAADVDYTDLDGLTFDWSVTGGAIDAPSASEAVWTLPTIPGKYLAQVIVTDRHGGMAVPATILDVPEPNLQT